MSKRIFTILIPIAIGTLFTIGVFAQTPEKMSYQAVIRNGSNALVTSTAVGMQISILQGSNVGTPVYLETQTPSTNANGLVSLEIGTGTTSNDFSSIDWSAGPYFIKTEIDPTGGTNYTITSTSQLLSVPYALHAKTAETITGKVSETDPVFDSWDKSTGISITENQISDLGSYIKTEEQSLFDVLSKSNDGKGQQIKNIANPTNEQDAVTKSYVKIRVSATGDTLFFGPEQWVIIPGISIANKELIKDGSGNVYTSVTIGIQDWLVENLKTTKYNDGSEIPLVSDFHSATPSYCWYKNDSTKYAQRYGALYNWSAVNTGKVCPIGWHVPSDLDWKALIDYLGGSSVAGDKLKELGTANWNNLTTGATNEVGFTALPGGYRYGSLYDFAGSLAVWWSTKEYSATEVWAKSITYDISYIHTVQLDKTNASYIRCVRD